MPVSPVGPQASRPTAGRLGWRSTFAIAWGVLTLVAWEAAAAPAAPDGAAVSPPAPAAAPVEDAKLACVTRHEQAQANRRARHLLQARDDLRICSRASCPGPIRDDCVDWFEQVNRSLPSVVVTARARGVDEADVAVLIDGALVADRLSGAALDVDPGEHRFRFQSPRWPAVERTILVSEGVKNRPIEVELAPPPVIAAPTLVEAPRPAPERRLDRWDYAIGGAAVGSLAAATYFGVSALMDRYRLMNRCAPFCSPAETTGVHNKLVAADVALGLAVACAGILTLHLTRPWQGAGAAASSSGGLSVIAGAGPNAGSLGLAGAF